MRRRPTVQILLQTQTGTEARKRLEISFTPSNCPIHAKQQCHVPVLACDVCAESPVVPEYNNICSLQHAQKLLTAGCVCSTGQSIAFELLVP